MHQRLHPTVTLEYPATGETQDRRESVLVQKLGHVDDDVQISALDPFYEMDGRKSRYIGEVLEWYRGEDAGDLKRSELNEFINTLTCLKTLEVNVWKSDQKVVMDDKFNPKIVMDEELVQNDVVDEDLVQKGVMDGKFVKNFVEDAEIDPKVVIHVQN